MTEPNLLRTARPKRIQAGTNGTKTRKKSGCARTCRPRRRAKMGQNKVPRTTFEMSPFASPKSRPCFAIITRIHELPKKYERDGRRTFVSCCFKRQYFTRQYVTPRRACTQAHVGAKTKREACASVQLSYLDRSISGDYSDHAPEYIETSRCLSSLVVEAPGFFCARYVSPETGSSVQKTTERPED